MTGEILPMTHLLGTSSFSFTVVLNAVDLKTNIYAELKL